MQINDLVQIVLDPNLGCPWPKNQLDFELEWYKGRKWRVEYTFASPAVPVAALAVGNQVRGVWRYEVIEIESDDEGKESVTLRISPERRGFEGYHFIATYELPSLRLLTVERFEGQFKRPFDLQPLPPLDQAVSRAGDGRSVNRSFVMKEEPELPPEGEVSADEAELELEGEDELFADAELIED
ncbi:MAG: hypothetical protein ACYTFT_05000 [Planctomycetota bacterium]|jgi:hypothetical protein